MSLDLLQEVRAAILTESEITVKLATWQDTFSIHSIRPAPDGAGYPMVMLSSRIPGDVDLVNTGLPVAEIDIAVYGTKPTQYREVEEIGYTLRQLFHRRREVLGAIDGIHVVQVTAIGPVEAPSDDDSLVGRLVSLTIQLQET